MVFFDCFYGSASEIGNFRRTNTAKTVRVLKALAQYSTKRRVCQSFFLFSLKTIGERTSKKRGGEELFIGAGFMRSINMLYRTHRTGLGAFGEKYSGAVFRHTEWIVQREKRSVFRLVF